MNSEDTEVTDQVSLSQKICLQVFDQVRLKQACTATDASERLEISDIETRYCTI